VCISRRIKAYIPGDVANFGLTLWHFSARSPNQIITTRAYSNPNQIKFYCELSLCFIQTVWMSLANTVCGVEKSMENSRGRTMFIVYLDRTHLSLNRLRGKCDTVSPVGWATVATPCMGDRWLRHGHRHRAVETQGDADRGLPGHFSRPCAAVANNHYTQPPHLNFIRSIFYCLLHVWRSSGAPDFQQVPMSHCLTSSLPNGFASFYLYNRILSSRMSEVLLSSGIWSLR
jgi:hypothetical protein